MSASCLCSRLWWLLFTAQTTNFKIRKKWDKKLLVGLSAMKWMQNSLTKRQQPNVNPTASSRFELWHQRNFTWPSYCNVGTKFVRRCSCCATPFTSQTGDKVMLIIFFSSGSVAKRACMYLTLAIIVTKTQTTSINKHISNPVFPGDSAVCSYSSASQCEPE